jgi:hypothetical protein
MKFDQPPDVGLQGSSRVRTTVGDLGALLILQEDDDNQDDDDDDEEEEEDDDDDDDDVDEDVGEDWRTASRKKKRKAEDARVSTCNHLIHSTQLHS